MKTAFKAAPVWKNYGGEHLKTKALAVYYETKTVGGGDITGTVAAGTMSSIVTPLGAMLDSTVPTQATYGFFKIGSI